MPYASSAELLLASADDEHPGLFSAHGRIALLVTWPPGLPIDQSDWS